VEFVWLAILLLVPLVWVVVSAFEVQRGAFAVTAAARSAGRAYVLSPDDRTGHERARSVMQRVLDDQGPEGMKGRLEVTCSPLPDRCVAGTSTVTVTVRSSVALPYVPSVLGAGRPSFALSASHALGVGQYVAVPDAGAP
jgi:hypothetical protein